MKMEGNIAEFAKEMKKLINNKEHRYEFNVMTPPFPF